MLTRNVAKVVRGHAGPGKTNHRFGFGNDQIAEAGVARHDPGSGGVGYKGFRHLRAHFWTPAEPRAGPGWVGSASSFFM